LKTQATHSRYRLLLLLPLLLLLHGCALSAKRQNQQIGVSTPFCPGADCTLVNDDGTSQVTTPGTARVGRDYDDLIVTCEKKDHEPVSILVSSSTRGMAFAKLLLGRVGAVGVEMATGSAYEYPAEIINPLDCRTAQQVAETPTVGHYDSEAAALVDTKACEVPRFAARDGDKEIYRTRCPDGKVGVITCSAGACLPVNISTPLSP